METADIVMIAVVALVLVAIVYGVFRFSSTK